MAWPMHGNPLGQCAARHFEVRYEDNSASSVGITARVAPIPTGFECPITSNIMLDPVMTSDGQVYERCAIEEWFRRGNRTSPGTNVGLSSLELIPLQAMQEAIQTFLRLRPEICQVPLDARSVEVAACALERDLLDKQGIVASLENEAARLRQALTAKDKLVRQLVSSPLARLQEALRKSFEETDESPTARARKLRCEIERIESEITMLSDFLDIARTAASELEGFGTRGEENSEAVTTSFENLENVQLEQEETEEEEEEDEEEEIKEEEEEEEDEEEEEEEEEEKEEDEDDDDEEVECTSDAARRWSGVWSWCLGPGEVWQHVACVDFCYEGASHWRYDSAFSDDLNSNGDVEVWEINFMSPSDCTLTYHAGRPRSISKLYVNVLRQSETSIPEALFAEKVPYNARLLPGGGIELESGSAKVRLNVFSRLQIGSIVASSSTLHGEVAQVDYYNDSVLLCNGICWIPIASLRGFAHWPIIKEFEQDRDVMHLYGPSRDLLDIAFAQWRYVAKRWGAWRYVGRKIRGRHLLWQPRFHKGKGTDTCKGKGKCKRSRR